MPGLSVTKFPVWHKLRRQNQDQGDFGGQIDQKEFVGAQFRPPMAANAARRRLGSKWNAITFTIAASLGARGAVMPSTCR